ncbi:hypothetical protein LEP1GSC052_1754 [Leptospira kmetyi serovar Malaysia str. Bejo-Iso9]|nr:hypothetical protein LEP1GSC052_1754 [Leptospira kmetyi serovar Malaysia str. Bejo-Iso9]
MVGRIRKFSFNKKFNDCKVEFPRSSFVGTPTKSYFKISS